MEEKEEISIERAKEVSDRLKTARQIVKEVYGYSSEHDLVEKVYADLSYYAQLYEQDLRNRREEEKEAKEKVEEAEEELKDKRETEEFAKRIEKENKENVAAFINEIEAKMRYHGFTHFINLNEEDYRAIRKKYATGGRFG